MSVILHTADNEYPTRVALFPVRQSDEHDAFCDFCGSVITTKVALVFDSLDAAGGVAVTEVACLSHLADIDPEVVRVTSA
jgi:hypothetical protein